ncbi:thiaminase II [Pseudonocardia acaciae]|uniref:thiaminase II n=1 Tax=Pseudonocardia acaciae TaxID=551276 RepID=UPI000569A42B|nr:thiaminase II [Pseudonocardia acaciae]
MASSEPLSARLWADIEHIYQAVLAHPFLTGLTDGSLPAESFRHFIVQDAHYLRGYARALAVCAAKAPTEQDTVMFAEHAAGAIAAEQQMHAELASALGSSSDESAAPVAPTTRAYVSYLLATVHGGSFAEGLGAVLPCYWIYARVGDELLARSSPDPLYARWISMYGGEEYQSVVNAVLTLTDRIGPTLAPDELDRVREHFVTTSRYEWMFWDAGYRREAWPI